MSVTSSIGLISGIDHQSLITQFMALEARPQTLVKNQTSLLQTQQVAFQSVNAKLLVLKMAAANLAKRTSFTQTSVTSSNDTVLTASAAATAMPGSYTFNVAKLVSTQQAISKGVADKDAALNLATTMTFEFGAAKLSTDTYLSQLNGGEGITRGKIRITDRAGASAVVDLSTAVSVNDVLDAINNTSGINVRASVEGDRFVLTDNTGANVTSLAVADVNTAGVAASLGLLGNAGTGTTLNGQAINTLGDNTQLTALNDGNGVRTVSALADFRITSSGGVSFDVDISSAKTVGDVINLINNHANNTGQTIVASRDGAGLKITDSSGGGSTFEITALNGSKAAEDLGILGSDADGSGAIEGDRILAGMNSKLLKNLRGGNGGLNAGVIDINGTQIDLSAARSVSDVVKTINDAGLNISASLNDSGSGIRLVGAPNSSITVSDVTGNAASFLGIDQSVNNGRIDSGNLQFRYISESTLLTSLNGGKGVAKGNFTITDSNGMSATVDMSSGDEITIADVLADINSRGLAINARINDNGDGILIEDTGSGSVAMKITEAGSTTARDLGILGEASAPGENIQGSFEKKVVIEATDSLATIVTKINDAGVGVTASVFNDGSSTNPYRLSLISKQEGKAGSFVFDDGGLNLGISNLVEAQDAVVFYGSSDPAKGIAVVSPTNTMGNLIPAMTINLKGVSSGPVTVTVNRDDAAVVSAVQKFVEDFNSVMTTIKSYNTYNKETETKGLLQGDTTLASITSSLYRLLTSRNNEVPGVYKSLHQVGLTLKDGATLELDATKLNAALAADREGVISLFSFKETQTNEETNVTTTVKAGVGVKLEELINRITDTVSGTMKNTLDGLNARIESNNKRIAAMQVLLDNKRMRYENSFAQMETALAQMQNQTSALNSLAQLASSYSIRRNN